MAEADRDYTTSVRVLARKKLPVLDLAPLFAGDRAGIDALAAQMRDVCEHLGFMCIVNHGIEPGQIEAMEREAMRFHNQPMDEKLKLKVNDHQRGYIPPRATLVKHSTYNENTKLDLNATYVLATEYAENDPGRMAGKQFYGPNRWPENLPGFREVAMDYMTAITGLGKTMLPLWALALELEENFFAPYFENNYTYFRVAYYPPKKDLDDNEYGIGAHADTGFMTFLPPAREEGIQILDTDDQWFWPDVEDGALIVNTGQFLERWSNSRFRATPHRVIPPTENERYSIPCFVNTNFESKCSCLPGCHGPDNPPAHKPESYWEFFTWYMANTYPHYGKIEADEGAPGQAGTA
jgi:isopenicillin N synthase-like dioxygenase